MSDARSVKRVYKYPLRIDDETWVTMHAEARILAVQEQHYARIKQVFVRRLRDEGVAHAIFPNTTWSSR